MAEEDFDLCPWCHKGHMRHLMPVKEARHQLGGISPTTFYALVKEGELSLVKIGRRSFVQAEDSTISSGESEMTLSIEPEGWRASPPPANSASLSQRTSTTAT
jgi:hypothetical protein